MKSVLKRGIGEKKEDFNMNEKERSDAKSEGYKEMRKIAKERKGYDRISILMEMI